MHSRPVPAVSLRVVRTWLGLAACAEHRGQSIQGARYERVVGPLAALVASEQPLSYRQQSIREATTNRREEVRARYAEAARAVMDPKPGISASCCGASPTDSCCGTGSAAEMFRVLVPGGRIGISDVVADDHMTEADRSAAGSYVGCIAGALSRTEYLSGLAAAGFTNASVNLTKRQHRACTRPSSEPSSPREPHGRSCLPERTLRPRSRLGTDGECVGRGLDLAYVLPPHGFVDGVLIRAALADSLDVPVGTRSFFGAIQRNGNLVVSYDSSNRTIVCLLHPGGRSCAHVTRLRHCWTRS
jgi:hypothetical protein